MSLGLVMMISPGAQGAKHGCNVPRAKNAKNSNHSTGTQQLAGLLNCLWIQRRVCNRGNSSNKGFVFKACMLRIVKMHRCPLFKNYTNQCFPYQLSISLNSVVFLSLCTGIDGGVLRGLQPWGCCLASPDSGSGSWLKMDPKRFQVTRSLPLQARYCSSRLLEFAEADGAGSRRRGPPAD